MHEVGRIREITFRHAGGGTGKALDIDSFDTDPDDPQKQLIVWDPENKMIIGGYRIYFQPKGSTKRDISKLASSSYFRFSRKFMKKYFPHMMELGRRSSIRNTSHAQWDARVSMPSTISGTG